jgi:hypothetical protein
MDKPKISRAEFIALIGEHYNELSSYGLFIAFIRGYRKNTMGKPGVNDRGIYDDAVAIFTNDAYYTFNANVDPQSYRKGEGFGDKKGIASIVAGVVFKCWKLDYHKNKYLALCQRLGPVTVMRDGNPPYLQTSAYLGINNHRGRISVVDSLGCCTVPENEYPDYINTVVSELTVIHGEITTGKFDSQHRPIYKDLPVPFIIIEN